MIGERPIELITGTGEAAAAGPPAWLFVAACFGLAASVGVIAALILRRGNREATPERAYRVLARKVGLSRRDAELLRAAAGRSGVPACAALVCERAFVRVKESDPRVALLGPTLGFA